jgi:hypothetical protein
MPGTGPDKYLPPTPEQIGVAACLWFIDLLPDSVIARQLGITRRTLARWKHRPEFMATMAGFHELYSWPEQALRLHRLKRG